jgi:hypothetical protein
VTGRQSTPPLSTRLLRPSRGGEAYTLALASNTPLPTPPPVVVLTQDVEIRRLIEQSVAAEAAQRQVPALELEARRAQEANERVQLIMRTKIFRYTWALGTLYARVQKLTRRPK